MPVAENTDSTTREHPAVRLAAAAMAAYDAYLQAAEPYFESRVPIPPAADKAIGAALLRHSVTARRLAQVNAPDAAGMCAKATVLLSEMTLQCDGTVDPTERALALAYSLARDILGEGFGAALDRVQPPHHRV
jgi:hypothetical protein